MIKKLAHFLGVQLDTTNHAEKLISAAGGFIGILLVLQITHFFIPGVAGALIVASMGASAVLLFAVPHGPLSQPWPLVAGHVFSALIGVTVRIYIPDMFLAGAIAVGLSIGVMYYLRCIHPPGGASALAAVVGGPDVYALGYQFVLTPVLLNAMVIVITAFLVNFPFPWRRYPVALSMKLQFTKEEKAAPCRYKNEGVIPRRDLEYALKEMRSFADVTEEELEKIYHTAKVHGEQVRLHADDIKLGHYYSHGNYGDQFVVRRVIDESKNDDPQKDMVIYKVITGDEKSKTATMTRSAFARWAKHEVVFYGNRWTDKDTHPED
ncbi:MAG TPA: HPP family protein [Gammaproteobacteria bacterium]